MDFTFLIGKYDEKRLTPQLAQALAAAKAAAGGADAKKRAAGLVRGRIGVAILMIALGAVLIYVSLRNPAINRRLYLPISLLAILASIYLLLTCKEAAWGMEKPSAKALLRSLNGIESSQKPMVRLRSDGVTITAKSGESHADFSLIDAAAETDDLIVLRHGRSVTVLQKRDLVSQNPEAVRAALQSALDCPYLLL